MPLARRRQETIQPTIERSKEVTAKQAALSKSKVKTSLTKTTKPKEVGPTNQGTADHSPQCHYQADCITKSQEVKHLLQLINNKRSLAVTTTPKKRDEQLFIDL